MSPTCYTCVMYLVLSSIAFFFCVCVLQDHYECSKWAWDRFWIGFVLEKKMTTGICMKPGVENCTIGRGGAHFNLEPVQMTVQGNEFSFPPANCKTWNMQCWTRSMEYRIWNTEHGMWNTEHGNQNMEHGTWKMEQYRISNDIRESRENIWWHYAGHNLSCWVKNRCYSSVFFCIVQD